MNRRLPVYILLDTSGSMRGEPIHAVNVGLRAMLNALRQDPYALEAVHLSVITFDIEVKEILPLTHLEQAQIPDIDVPQSGATHVGEALRYLVRQVDRNTICSTPEQKGDWRPMLFLMTDGSPSDIGLFEDMIAEVKRRNFARIVACAAGPKAKQHYLQQLTDTVVSLDTSDSSTFQQFFEWVSGSVSTGSMSAGVEDGQTLPPPPPEIQVVI